MAFHPHPFLGYAILLFFLISGFCIHFPNTDYNKAAPFLENLFHSQILAYLSDLPSRGYNNFDH